MIIDNGKIRFSVGAEWSDRSSYFSSRRNFDRGQLFVLGS